MLCKQSLIYLALNAIVMSLPSRATVMFSVTFPISEELVSVKSLSLTSNLTRLFVFSLARRLALSKPNSSCLLFMMIELVVLN